MLLSGTGCSIKFIIIGVGNFMEYSKYIITFFRRNKYSVDK
jgi:hypothetical protein